VNWTDKLQEILAWVASHGSRLRRKGYEPPNHLSGAFVYLLDSKSGDAAQSFTDLEETTLNTNPIVLDANGALSGLVVLPKGKIYRLEIKERDLDNGGPGAILFTQDNIWAV
jgi:hypothetical protein